jgi:ubiquinone/menaquinone biosynthesis C-methylase UbiE
MWLGNEGCRRAGVREGVRFLDVAAGSGALSIPAARLGAAVLAIDQSPAMLEHLRARARRDGLDIETRVMDGQALPFADDTFDVAGSQVGVMLFPDMPQGIREMVRVVKPGGRVLVSAYGDPSAIDFLRFFVAAVQMVRPGFSGPSIDRPPLEFQLAHPERLARELIAAGLKNVKVETIIETTEFETGWALWDWIVSSNPIVEHMLESLDLGDEEKDIVRLGLDRLIRQRAAAHRAARLANPVNIGVGTK